MLTVSCRIRLPPPLGVVASVHVYSNDSSGQWRESHHTNTHVWFKRWFTTYVVHALDPSQVTKEEGTRVVSVRRVQSLVGRIHPKVQVDGCGSSLPSREERNTCDVHGPGSSYEES